MEPGEAATVSSQTSLLNHEIKHHENQRESDYDSSTGSERKSERSKTYPVVWQRWFILFQFSMVSLLQTAISGTWSPISISASKIMGFTEHDYDLLVNWGVASQLIFLPIDMWLLIKFGLRMAVFSGTICLCLGAGIRCLPLGQNQKYAIHVGQFLNGIAGCPVMACAPALSNTWFPLRDRVLATGIMIMTGSGGQLVSFLLGPFLVQQWGNNTGLNTTEDAKVIRHEITIYLLIEFGIAVVLFFMMLTYFPNKPPSPPSLSAESDRLTFLVGIKSLLKNSTYWSVVFIYCMLAGSFVSFMGIMPLIYEKRGISQETIGVMGSVMTALGVLLGIVFSWAADRMKTHRSILWISSTIVTFLSCLYVVAVSLNWIPHSIFKFSLSTMWISVTILGILTCAIQPLAMEMAADAAYPISEGTSSYFLVWLIMLTSVIFFSSLSAAKSQNVAFYLMLGCMSAAMPFIYFSVRKSTTRMEVDLATN